MHGYRIAEKYLKSIDSCDFALYDFKRVEGITKNIQHCSENLKPIVIDKSHGF